MKVAITKNLIYKGSNSRSSLLDVYIPEKDGHIPLLIFIHGFKGFKDWGAWSVILEQLAHAGFAVVSFNMTHNGGTIKNPVDFPDLDAFAENTYSKELVDLDAVINWIIDKKQTYFQKVNLDDIRLIGHSRGGGIALIYAAKHEIIKQVITWAAVDSFENRLPNKKQLALWKKNRVDYIENKRTKQQMPMNYSFVEDLLANKEYLSIEKAVCQLKIPQLIIHGTIDDAVKPEAARQLKKWNPNAELVFIQDANHVFNCSHPFDHKQLSVEAEKLIQETILFLV